MGSELTRSERTLGVIGINLFPTSWSVCPGEVSACLHHPATRLEALVPVGVVFGSDSIAPPAMFLKNSGALPSSLLLDLNAGP